MASPSGSQPSPLAERVKAFRTLVWGQGASSANRKRRLAVVGGLSAAVLVAAGGIGYAVLPASSLPQWLAGDAQAPLTATTDLIGLPATVSPPASAPILDPAKPADLGPNLRGRLVYTTCATDCDPYLVLSDGRQLKLPRSPRGSALADITLSPDGRWLGQPDGAGYLVRDLAGDQLFKVPAPAAGRVVSPWAWAPDSRNLLLADHADGKISSFVLYNPAAEEFSTPAVPSQPVVGVLTTGDLVLGDPNTGPGKPAAGKLTLNTLDFATGKPDRTIAVDPGEQLRQGESLAQAGAAAQVVGARGGQQGAFFVVVSVPQPGGPVTGRPVAVLQVGMDGKVTARHEVTVSATAADTDTWALAGQYNGGLLFTRLPADAGQPMVIVSTPAAVGSPAEIALDHQASTVLPGAPR